MKRIVVHLLIAVLIVLGVAGVAQASAGLPLIADYTEECQQEGCSNGELADLYNTFQHECFTEGCWHEEVVEIAGNTGAVQEMYRAFGQRLGRNVDEPQYRGESTPGLWEWLCEFTGQDPQNCEIKGSLPPVSF